MNIAKEVNLFIGNHARALPPEDREDLKQDILLALVESFGPSFENCAQPDVVQTAIATLTKFRDERRGRSLPPNWKPFDTESLVPDSSAPDLDLKLDMQKALAQLPGDLLSIAIDLFYLDLSQQEVAVRCGRSQSSIAAAKKKIVKQLHSILKEKPCQ